MSGSKIGKALFMQSFWSKVHLHSHVRLSKVGNIGFGHSVISQMHRHSFGSKIGSAGLMAKQSASEVRLHSIAQMSGLKIGLSTVANN